MENDAKEGCFCRDNVREALVRLAQSVQDFMATKGRNFYPDMAVALDAANAALAAPPRNCEVGTEDEQAERFENFCLKHIGCAEETGGRHCVGCPLEKASRNTTQKCELYWAQMPYEEQ